MDHFLDALEETEGRFSDIVEDCEKENCSAMLDYSNCSVRCRCGKRFDEYGFPSEDRYRRNMS